MGGAQRYPSIRAWRHGYRLRLNPSYDPSRISTYPSVPFTRIRCPSLISLVAFSTPTIGRQAVFACDDRAMGHQPTHFGHQAFDGHEQGRPAGVGEGGDQDIALFQVGIFHVQDDACPSLDDAGGNRQADDGPGWEILSLVLACNDFAIGRHDTRRRQLFIPFVLVFSLGDDPVIQLVACARLREVLQSDR